MKIVEHYLDIPYFKMATLLEQHLIAGIVSLTQSGIKNNAIM